MKKKRKMPRQITERSIAIVVRRELGVFAKHVDRRFAAVDKRFDAMEARTDQRFDDMEARMDQRFGDMESRMDQRFGDLESRTNHRFSQMGALIEHMDDRFDRLAEAQEGLGDRMDKQETALTELREGMDYKFGVVFADLGATKEMVAKNTEDIVMIKEDIHTMRAELENKADRHNVVLLETRVRRLEG